MKLRLLSGSLVLVCLSLLLGAGCAKKRTGTMPTGASKVEVVEEERQWQTPPAKEDRAIEERRLAEESRLARERERQAAEKAVADMIHFSFDSYELTAESREVLQAKAGIMKSQPAMRMVVEGYCDERGTEEYNLALGERRARAAYEFLILLGVAPERLSIVSFGEERPLDPGNNETAWAMNRRDEFRVSE
ncbi:MAG: peptidoglycan-associated lipoprotein Pal [Desulfovibrionaceae bacterium]|nr:peptidoglycan-associated lipoprotein Pal [Desulfovibrionaceae bacterium]MDD4952026.1 peptidoglycan-associated lipoprotein Pal [Desulfovibrionaceae bacterium]